MPDLARRSWTKIKRDTAAIVFRLSRLSVVQLQHDIRSRRQALGDVTGKANHAISRRPDTQRSSRRDGNHRALHNRCVTGPEFPCGNPAIVTECGWENHAPG